MSMWWDVRVCTAKDKGQGCVDEDVVVDGVRTCCAPCCCASISFSCATIFASSSSDSASGRPTSKALVVTIHTRFPTNLPPAATKDVVAETREAMAWRVVGGTMSTSAARRS